MNGYWMKVTTLWLGFSRDLVGPCSHLSVQTARFHWIAWMEQESPTQTLEKEMLKWLKMWVTIKWKTQTNGQRNTGKARLLFSWNCLSQAWQTDLQRPSQNHQRRNWDWTLTDGQRKQMIWNDLEVFQAQTLWMEVECVRNWNRSGDGITLRRFHCSRNCSKRLTKKLEWYNSTTHGWPRRIRFHREPRRTLYFPDSSGPDHVFLGRQRLTIFMDADDLNWKDRMYANPWRREGMPLEQDESEMDINFNWTGITVFWNFLVDLKCWAWNDWLDCKSTEAIVTAKWTKWTTETGS